MNRLTKEEWEREQALDRRKAELVGEWVKLPRHKKVQLLEAVTNYRSGTDSIGSVYMGGIAHAGLQHCLGAKYGRDSYDALFARATEKQLNDGLEYCWSYIDYMLQHPTEKCPCCGQIVPKKESK